MTRWCVGGISVNDPQPTKAHGFAMHGSCTMTFIAQHLRLSGWSTTWCWRLITALWRFLPVASQRTRSASAIVWVASCAFVLVAIRLGGDERQPAGLARRFRSDCGRLRRPARSSTACGTTGACWSCAVSGRDGSSCSRSSPGSLLEPVAAADGPVDDRPRTSRPSSTKPDNVPIVGLVFLLGFFTWLATAKAVENDDRDRAGPAAAGKAGRRKGAGLARPGLHRTDLHGRADGVSADLGHRPAGAAGRAGQRREDAQPVEGARGTSSACRKCWSTTIPWMAGVVLPSLVRVGLMAIPFLDFNKKGNGYYTIERAEVQLPDLSVRLSRAVGHADHPGHVPPRAELELLRALRILGPAQGAGAQQRRPVAILLDRLGMGRGLPKATAGQRRLDGNGLRSCSASGWASFCWLVYFLRCRR